MAICPASCAALCMLWCAATAQRNNPEPEYGMQPCLRELGQEAHSRQRQKYFLDVRSSR